jgi:hypothetical protein
VKLYVLPGSIGPESNAPGGTDVTVCLKPSSLVQVTVVPFEIPTVPGTKVELLISTLIGAGVVVAGACVGAVVVTGVGSAGRVVVVVVHPLINTAITNSTINHVFFILTSRVVCIPYLLFIIFGLIFDARSPETTYFRMEDIV